MLVYRFVKEKYKHDLSGRGAEKSGGRWNYKGTPLIYTGDSAPLVVLEYLPQLRRDEKNKVKLPVNLVVAVIEIPDSISMITIKEKELPADWNSVIHPDSTKNLGTRWASEMKSAVLKVPSVHIPYGHSWNYLLNPLHSEFKQVNVVKIFKYEYDIRVKSESDES